MSNDGRDRVRRSWVGDRAYLQSGIIRPRHHRFHRELSGVLLGVRVGPVLLPTRDGEFFVEGSIGGRASGQRHSGTHDRSRR